MPFYNEKNLSLPLDVILLKNGYFYKKEKCSVNFLTMKNDNDDLIIITRANNGHYLYFNPLDDKDKGNIYSFCKNRGVKLNDLLGISNENDKSKALDLKLKDIKHSITPSSLNHKAIEALNLYKELKNVTLSDNFFVMKRFIAENTLQEFKNLKQDRFHNICVPSYKLDSCKDISFVNMCGFMSYLKSPIKKDKGFIKQLCYGNKGLEVLKNEHTQLSDIKHIILCESMIDSLSLFELSKLESKDTLLCSTNGQITPHHYELVNFLIHSSKAHLIIGFDNDEKGQSFTQKTVSALKESEFEVKIPCLKDFNDDLITCKLLSFNKAFTMNELDERIKTMLLEPIHYFLKHKDVFVSDALKPNLNRTLRAKTLLEFLEPKLQSFISLDKTIQTALTQMKEYESKNLQRSRK